MTTTFITSSGTGIGKTLVTAALAYQLKVRAIKPVASGIDLADTESDPALLLKAMGQAPTPDNILRIAPWCFKARISPHLAAKRESKVIFLNEVVQFCKSQASGGLIVEGSGGVMAPLSDTETQLDLMLALGAPAVLVVGSYLGSISHTLSAHYTLQKAGVKIAGVVVSASEEEPQPTAETVSTLKGFMPNVPILTIPRLPKSDAPWTLVPDLTGLIA